MSGYFSSFPGGCASYLINYTVVSFFFFFFFSQVVQFPKYLFKLICLLFMFAGCSVPQNDILHSSNVRYDSHVYYVLRFDSNVCQLLSDVER